MSIRSRHRRRRLWPWLLAAYAVTLAASHIVRARTLATPLDDPRPSLELRAVHDSVPGQGTSDDSRVVRVAYSDEGDRRVDRPAILLLHGSPGSGRQLRRLAERLAPTHRVIVPDLPGFGRSTRSVPSYSIRAHGAYVRQLLDRLGVTRAHVVGFSMGGGVALSLVGDDPQRVASLTMLSAIGAQEFELLGDYHLNHLVHGAQLVGLRALADGLPHFGALDDAMLSVPYARNFYDSDQRPLRGILERLEMPTLILHGTHDSLVPIEAAIEHARLVPHSELHTFDDDHFMPFMSPDAVATAIEDFVSRVDRGDAPWRSSATVARLEAARASTPNALRLSGLSAVVAAGLLAVSTLISEDLTCLGAGMLAAKGRLAFAAAVGGCFAGIFIGDALLFFAGRWVGRSVGGQYLLRRLVGASALARSTDWLDRRGASVILTSRFLPGTRLPTYVAAGVAGVAPWRFLGYFALASALWTPLVVGLAAYPTAALARVGLFQPNGLVQTAVTLLVMLVTVRIVSAMVLRRGRRSLVGTWRRWTRWEFWPPWLAYPPVIAYVAWLAIRHRSLTVFTAANPAIPGGGFVGESKFDILTQLGRATHAVAPFTLLTAEASRAEARDAARRFAAIHGLPLVLKPDQGQRGSGVVVARSPDALDRAVDASEVDTILQRYVPGAEFGLFYYRYPSDAHGRLFSMTEKRRPVVIGDGRRTLEDLILDDDRAVAMARQYLEVNAARRDSVPAVDERVELTELGTHCRGAIFLDGAHAASPVLEEAVDRIGTAMQGFFFGRFDVRTDSLDALKAGHFTILELNGVTSEATHIYDPRHSVWVAYRTLFEQWRIAFDIGAMNRERGVVPTSLRTLAVLGRGYRRTAGAHLTSTPD